MAALDTSLGVVLCLLAALTGGMRVKGLHTMLGWLQPMKERYGARVGDAIHFTVFTVCPALLGLSFLVLAWARLDGLVTFSPF